jgi:hypothetical protein
MSKKSIVALVYYRHKLSDLIYVASMALIHIYPKLRKFERVKIQLAKTSDHLTFHIKCKFLSIGPD